MNRGTKVAGATRPPRSAGRSRAIRKLARAAGAASVSVAVLAIAPAMAHAGASATLSVNNDAKLQSDGSAIVTVTYSCFPGFFFGASGDISIDLEQLHVVGVDDVPAVCDDQNHTTTLHPRPGPFTPGEASANVQVNASNAQATQQVEVNVQY